MKEIRRYCAAITLTLGLSVLAVAGEIGTPGIATTGNTPATNLAALDPLREFALALIQSVLSLF